MLVIAAHSDDDAFGCGGTLIKLAKLNHEIHSLYFTDGVSSRNYKKNLEKKIIERRKYAQAASKIIGIKKCKFFSYPDNKLDTVPFLEIVKNIEIEISRIKPEIIFTHYENDLNIDHQIINRAVVTATRPKPKNQIKQILLFETLSSTEWKFSQKNQQFNPNFHVDISKTITKKVKAASCYKEEIFSWPHPRSKKGIKNLAMIRGQNVGLKYAEAFYLLRKVIN